MAVRMSSSLDPIFDTAVRAPRGRGRGAAQGGGAAHPRPRRGDGHADPDLRLQREPLPRGAIRVVRVPSPGQQRPSDADPAASDRGHPFRLRDGRRRHSRDQHLLLDLDRSRRLRHGGGGLRAQPRRRPARAARSDQGGAGGRTAPFRRGRARPHQPHRLPVARRQQPGISAPSRSTTCARLMPSRSAA